MSRTGEAHLICQSYHRAAKTSVVRGGVQITIKECVRALCGTLTQADSCRFVKNFTIRTFALIFQLIILLRGSANSFDDFREIIRSLQPQTSKTAVPMMYDNQWIRFNDSMLFYLLSSSSLLMKLR